MVHQVKSVVGLTKIYFRLQVPVTFCWKSGDSVETGHGTTREIGSFGAFINSREGVPQGARMQIQVTLTGENERYPDLTFYGEGRVERIHCNEAGPCGFEVSAQFYLEFADRAGRRSSDCFYAS